MRKSLSSLGLSTGTSKKEETDIDSEKEEIKVHRSSSNTLEKWNCSTTLFVESEQKITDKDGSLKIESEPQRPASAGRHRTPPTELEHVLKSDTEQIRYFRNIVTFDTEIENTYPERTDSETNMLIQHLKEVTHTASEPQSQDKIDTFATSIPEEDLMAARKRREQRRLAQEALIWKSDDFSKRLTMEEVVNDKVYEHYSRGIQQSSDGQFEAAVTSFSKAINLQASEISCYVERGEAYLQLCDFRSAHLNYKKAHCMQPNNSHIRNKLAFISYLEGQCLFDQTLYTEALECFTQASEMKPNVQGYHMRAVACLAVLGRHQECLALVTRQLENESTGNAELHVLRARLHMQFGNATLCYYDVRDALSLDSQQPQASEMMKAIKKRAARARDQAMELTVQGKLHEALKKITTSVETDPSVSEYHVLRGALHRRVENFNSAIDDFILAMDKSDHNESEPVYMQSQRQLLLTYNDFAVHCYNKGFYEEAVILLNKAIKGEKNEKALYVNRGDCFFKLNELGFALADYQQALEIEAECWAVRCRVAVVHNEFGISAYQDRLYDEAVRRFSLSIENNNKVGQFYVHRARSYYMLHDVDEARNDVLVSLHLDPDNEEIVPLLSRLYPGRTVKEVLLSKAADLVRKKLASSVKLPPVTRVQSSRKESTAKSARIPSATQASSPTSPPAITSFPFTPSGGGDDIDIERLSSAETSTPAVNALPSDKEIIRMKHTVSDEIKTLMRFPQSLKKTGPRIRATVKPTSSVTVKPTSSVSVKEDGKREKRVYSWKKFGVAIS